MFIDDDSIIHVQTSLLCKFKIWTDSDSRHDSIYFESAPASGPDREAAPVFFNSRHRIICHNIHSLLAIIIIKIKRQIVWENFCANCLVRKDHHDFFANHRQRRGDLRTDEAAADYQKTFAALTQRAQPLIILQIAEIDDVLTSKWQADRRAARRKQ